jgi:D-serine deaminase-like pyridoxal phosphate-dependent protein
MLQITRPTLLLDEQKCKRNIERMAEKAITLGVQLIPHMKTPQSHEIAGWCAELGLNAITVSSVKMAAYFAEEGWKDITIAFPVNLLEINEINRLLEMGVDLKLFVIDSKTAHKLGNELTRKVRIFIELDAGYNRTGIPTGDLKLIKTLAKCIVLEQKLDLYGIYCHPGDTYMTSDDEEIRSLWTDALKQLNSVKMELRKTYPDLKLRMGDTPGCSVVDRMEGVDEISAGNFIFFDLVMKYLKVCKEADIAVSMACPVVAKNAARKEILIHGGAVHFSKDHLFNRNGKKFYGEVVILMEDGWSASIEGIQLKSLSQEHGILSATSEVFETIELGDVLGILPVHSCLTANMMKSYITLDGRHVDHLEGRVPIHKLED